MSAPDPQASYDSGGGVWDTCANCGEDIQFVIMDGPWVHGNTHRPACVLVATPRPYGDDS